MSDWTPERIAGRLRLIAGEGAMIHVMDWAAIALACEAGAKEIERLQARGAELEGALDHAGGMFKITVDALKERDQRLEQLLRECVRWVPAGQMLAAHIRAELGEQT